MQKNSIFISLTLAFSSFAARGEVKATAKPEPSLLALPVVKPTRTVTVKDGETVTITAAPVREKIDGKWVKRFAYNGMIPGPTFIVKHGAKAKVVLINKIGLATTVHPHGLRVDDKNDGVVGIGQDPVQNGSSFTYSLKFPDLGMYWYHPHMKEEFTQEMGLYGQFLVVPAAGSGLTPQEKAEVVVLDDILVEDGVLPRFETDDTSFALMGRYGNRLLVNNGVKWTRKYLRNDVVRMYFVNTSNVRPFRVGFTNARMKVVGGDNGYYEKDFFAEDITISPAERYIVDVMFDKVGTATLWHRSPDKKITLGTVSVKSSKAAKNPEFELLVSRPTITEDMRQVRSLSAKDPQFAMSIDAKLSGEHAEHMSMPSHSTDGIEWEDEMGAMSAGMTQNNVQWNITDPATGKTNMDIHWKFNEGEPIKIRIENKGKVHPMQHPIHFHGQRFVVLARNGKPESNLVWKDTAQLPAGQTMDVVLDNLNPGRWMGHCHIAEHLAVGMMFAFDVVPKNK